MSAQCGWKHFFSYFPFGHFIYQPSLCHEISGLRFPARTYTQWHVCVFLHPWEMPSLLEMWEMTAPGLFLRGISRCPSSSHTIRWPLSLLHMDPNFLISDSVLHPTGHPQHSIQIWYYDLDGEEAMSSPWWKDYFEWVKWKYYISKIFF